MFKKVMVAVDFSGPAMELLNAVEDLKKLGLQELVIVHVIRTETAGLGLSASRRDFLKKIGEREQELESEGLSVKVLQPVGSPSEEIRNLAAEEKANLILIGSLGEGSSVRKLLLGSTVASVLRSTKTPVLVEKYKGKKGQPERIPIFDGSKAATAMLATDFSRSSLHVFDNFLEYPDTFSKVVLYHVVDEGYTKAQLNENKEKAINRLEGWESEFRERGFDVEIDVSTGIASELIVKAAKKKDVSMLALARRGRSMIDEMVIGSTADHIVRKAHCPTLLFIS